MANINKPTLDGIIMPYPSAAKIIPIWNYAENTTLVGTTKRDVMGRKYSYEMSWSSMNSDHYTALENVVNGLDPVIFVYEKWPQSAAGILVLPRLTSRELVAGVGDWYWSSVTLECVEVNSRIN